MNIPAPKIAVLHMHPKRHGSFLENVFNSFDRISVTYGDHGSKWYCIGDRK
jgi:hypothetical protein